MSPPPIWELAASTDEQGRCEVRLLSARSPDLDLGPKRDHYVIVPWASWWHVSGPSSPPTHPRPSLQRPGKVS